MRLGLKSTRGWFVDTAKTRLSFSSEDVERFWSSVALRNYEAANAQWQETHVQRYEISVPRLALPERGRLLNLWSRQGGAIPFIRRRFPQIELLNVEISTVMLAQARSRFPSEKFVSCNLETIPCETDSFDAILSLEMLEHSPAPQSILNEISRVLKKNGQLILTCPSLFSEAHLWVADRLLGNHGEGPHRFPSVSEVKTGIRCAGLELVSHRATLFWPLEQGALGRRINGCLEPWLQWFPACELGIRQLYEARKP